MTHSLNGKTALVTGASSGIGRAVALALAGAGASVTATGRDEARLADLAAGAKGAIRTLAGDLTDGAFVDALAARAGAVDLLVNSAGTLTYAPLLDHSDEQIEAMFGVNVIAALALTRRIAAAMVENGGGHVIMLNSLAWREVYRFGVVYCATKHALAALSKGLRLELQDKGIKVTDIAPGMVATSMRDDVDHPEVLAAIAARAYAPLSAEEVADAVMFAATAPANCSVDLVELRPVGSG